MKTADLQEFAQWLKQQIENSAEVIGKAKQINHFYKEVQYEAMKEAYLKCLEKLKDASIDPDLNPFTGLTNGR